jgi:hypothetical protein
LLRICLLNRVSGKEPVTISGFSGFHGGGATAQLLEQSDVPIFVLHVVPLKNDSTLELPVGVIGWQLGFFLNAYGEHAANVGLLASAFALTGNV